MVRFTLALAGQPINSEAAMQVEEKIVNIFAGEQLEEYFLTTINTLGLVSDRSLLFSNPWESVTDIAAKVPVLTYPALGEPLPDSVDITHYIAERYPQLRPDEIAEEIKQHLLELHSLNFFSLSFGSRPQQAEALVAAIDERLKMDISDGYRKALEFKRQ